MSLRAIDESPSLHPGRPQPEQGPCASPHALDDTSSSREQELLTTFPDLPHEAPVDAPSVSTPRVAETTLRDRACFRGHVNDACLPSGHGVLYTAQGTHQFAGVFHPHEDTNTPPSRQRGVQLLPNGSLFAGDFAAAEAHGHGVKRDPFGSQFLGQWCDGELDGVGLSVDVEGHAQWGMFQLNEFVEEGHSARQWQEQTERHAIRALLAERSALQDQELAREVELRVVLQGLSTIGDAPFGATDEIQQFAREEQQALGTFLEETKQQLAEVERDADRYKFQEAQLKERQKNLRREITDTRTTLSYASKYVALAETRSAQVKDAERTLASLQRQLQNMEQQLLVGNEKETQDA